MRSTVRWCWGTRTECLMVRISETIISCTIEALQKRIEERQTVMRAAFYNGPHSIEMVERPDPVLTAPTDAVVRVVLGAVCGSDLWYYRGESPHAIGPIGHEFIGIVEEVGAEVGTVAPGDLVIAPFT